MCHVTLFQLEKSRSALESERDELANELAILQEQKLEAEKKRKAAEVATMEAQNQSTQLQEQLDAMTHKLSRVGVLVV